MTSNIEPVPKMSRRLPTFLHGGIQWTVDKRLAEFRGVEWVNGEPSIHFVPFDSIEGFELLTAFIAAQKNGDESQGEP